ncbi:MAG: phytanoyl-CoA dioxygenase family protein [Gemmatimonadota bacterium]|nr:phytanoyl-CoA dioxygenase family protein [Gemmatimonadota bacterium]
MTPEIALQKREQLTTDGFCVLEDILTDGFLEELRTETDRLLDSVDHPEKWKYQGSDLHVSGKENSLIEKLVNWPPAWAALREIGLGDFESHGGYIILSKPPGGPPLYWHQDWMDWNDPVSLAPWPQYLFLSYYIVDTDLVNGCFQIIPGTHRKRIPLHDELEIPHQETAYFADEDDQAMFAKHRDAVDVPVKAGSLVIGEGRTLHAARGNQSDKRRTLLLGWHERPRDTIPSYWTGDVPEELLDRDPDAEYPRTRVPGEYLVSE